MKKVFKRIPVISMQLMLLLSAVNHAFALSPGNANSHQIQLQQEEPKLSIKKSEDDGNKNVYLFDVSIVNAAVEKALNGIKQIHKPGASIAYEFREFELDPKAKTLKVVIDKNVLTQQELLEYLQVRLTNALKQTI